MAWPLSTRSEGKIVTRVRGNLARIDCLIYGMVKSNPPRMEQSRLGR